MRIQIDTPGDFARYLEDWPYLECLGRRGSAKRNGDMGGNLRYRLVSSPWALWGNWLGRLS